ncbi:hypothetical protein AHAS_Ahas09G0090000 [Arachis hypogaea]
MDAIQEWIHITVGSGGFDVLVKEVGHEGCSLKCTEKPDKEVIITGEKNDNDIVTSVGVDMVQQLQAAPAHEVAHDEDMIIQVHQEEEGDKGRVVNPITNLNEWFNDSNYQNRLNFGTDHLAKGENQGLANLGGGTVISDTADSEMTLSYDYNGPNGGGNKGKQKQVCQNLYWACKNNNMKEGNQFLLGLDSNVDSDGDNGLLERPGRARRESLTSRVEEERSHQNNATALLDDEDAVPDGTGLVEARRYAGEGSRLR